jgi:hypothetical protein
MSVSRSFAPIPPADPSAPPAFPSWPFAFTAYADHCQRDYSSYLERLSKADDALAVIQAEETLGLNLLAEMNQAFYAMVWAPLGMAMGATGGQTTPAP